LRPESGTRAPTGSSGKGGFASGTNPDLLGGRAPRSGYSRRGFDFMSDQLPPPVTTQDRILVCVSRCFSAVRLVALSPLRTGVMATLLGVSGVQDDPGNTLQDLYRRAWCLLVHMAPSRLSDALALFAGHLGMEPACLCGAAPSPLRRAEPSSSGSELGEQATTMPFGGTELARQRCPGDVPAKDQAGGRSPVPRASRSRATSPK
jgi:hypothetical protein